MPQLHPKARSRRNNHSARDALAVIAALAFAIDGCSPSERTDASNETADGVVDAPAGSAVEDLPHNVMIVVADDVGVEKIGVYAEHRNAGPTPTIDRMAAEGMLFRNVWSAPTCSPTRATILTGRHVFHTKIGQYILNGPRNQVGLSLAEVTLPEILVDYDSAAVGKWHLSGTDENKVQDYTHPIASGFRYFAGSMGNLSGFRQGPTAGYSNWEKTIGIAGVNGPEATHERVSTYATKDTVDEAIGRLAVLKEPWLLYVAFNAPHSPFHLPPPEYSLTTPFADPLDPTETEMYRAMMEVLDTELGRLLDELKSLPAGQRTTVIFLGDNGTPGPVTEPPIRLDHAKGTLYEGGVNVPMIIVSPLIAQSDRGSESAALISTRDIFATVAEIAGETPELPRDESISMLPYLADPSAASQRALVHSQWFTPNGDGPYTHFQLAARDRRFKLLRTLCDQETEEFYDLETDPYENTDLLAGALTARQAVAHTILAAELDGKNLSCP